MTFLVERIHFRRSGTCGRGRFPLVLVGGLPGLLAPIRKTGGNWSGRFLREYRTQPGRSQAMKRDD